MREELVNRYYEYFDDDDIEGDEEYIDVLDKYQSEEIPGDYLQETTDAIKESTGIDIYAQENDECIKKSSSIVKQN